MILTALLAAAAAKAVACTGETTTRSVIRTDVAPFGKVFILNDAAKSWRWFSPGTGGTEAVCVAPACSLNYGPKMLIATQGKLKQALDREAGTYRAVDLDNAIDPVVTVTTANCFPTGMPAVKTGPRKF